MATVVGGGAVTELPATKRPWYVPSADAPGWRGAYPPEGADVLVIDDEVDLVEELCDGLADRGLSTIGTPMPEAVRQLLATGFRPPRVVVLDIKMPGIDGFALAEHWNALRASDLGPRIIFVTGHATIDEAIAAVRHQAFDFFRKPLAIDPLSDSIRDALRQPMRR